MATSRITAGILPIELAIIKRPPLMEVKVAPAVTIPDGTKGIILSKIISANTWMGELFLIFIKIE